MVKELHVFGRRLVRLEHRELCWAGGGHEEVGRAVGVIGKKEVTGARSGGDRSQIGGGGGRGLEFSSQRIGKPLDDVQQKSAMASSVLPVVWAGKGEAPI